MAATFPILEHARIVSRDPNVRIQIQHADDCRALDGEPCRCEPSVKIVRPSKKAGAR